MFQWSATELILACMKEQSDTDFLLIGHVRNSMDTPCSQYKRWKTRPEQLQTKWRIAHKNLLKLREFAGDRLIIIRYQDMVSSLESLSLVFEFCNVSINTAEKAVCMPGRYGKMTDPTPFHYRMTRQALS